MQLIKEIEIKNFRSISHAKFSAIDDLNLFHGANDVGKSNVLRALNLFFNGKTNNGVDFDFERDYCRMKLVKAKTDAEAKRNRGEDARARLERISVKITFYTPEEKRRALGKKFWVEKSWNQRGEVRQNVGCDKKKLKSVPKIDIRYHYIPAIKDKSILAGMLGELCAALSKQDGFKEILEGFGNEVQQQTEILSQELQSKLPLSSSKLIPPTDFTSLFRAQDFLTATAEGDECSLLLQHGDGILVRHIPSILLFLAAREASSYHIWGFEEPENSLELHAAVAEADRFVNYAHRNNVQIFLTSHSPAFYTLDPATCAKFFAQKKDKEHGVVTEWTQLKEMEEIVSFMGDHDIFDSLFSSFEKMHYLQEVEEKYKCLVKEENKPILFVEGDCDKIILDAAAKIYFEQKRKIEIPVAIHACQGTTHMGPLSATGINAIAQAISGNSEGKILFVLTDNDGAGRKTGKNPGAVNASIWNTSELNVYWRRLPYSQEMSAAMEKMGIPEDKWPGVIENCFPVKFRRRAKDKYVVGQKHFPDVADYVSTITSDPEALKKWVAAAEDSDVDFYLKEPDADCKEAFARFVAKQSKRRPEILEWAEPIFSGMLDAIEKAKKVAAAVKRDTAKAVP